MKQSLYLLFGAIILVMDSCKKDVQPIVNSSSLTIVNTAPDIPGIAVTFAEKRIAFSLSQGTIGYQSATEYANPAGQVPLTLVSSADTTRPFFQGNLNLISGGIYSLFISAKNGTIDTLLTKDHIVNYQDSVAGMRIVNLSPDAGPVSINLQGNTTADFNNLNYKQVSAFKTYPATPNIGYAHTFELRDKADNLLLTFNWYFTLFRNHTLVICGSKDPTSSTPLAVFQVNNY